MSKAIFERKLAIALNFLRRTSISSRNYSPPTFLLLWKVGVRIPPPHFLSFASCALFMGTPFALFATGVAMMNHETTSVQAGVTATAFVGVVFGLLIASYYRIGRTKCRMPKWQDL